MEQITFPSLFVHDDTCPDNERGGYKGQFSILTGPGYTDGVKSVASIPPYGGFFPDRNEAKAYAQLFSAAPDMFLVIKELYEYTKRHGIKIYMQEEIDAAYLKATGQVITPIENH
jgi:hypothetical protein